jgi:transcriptional regulator with XRE-family HTH domain
MNVVRELLRKRLKQGITRRRLADELGVHYNTLMPVLYGKREPTHKVLKALGLRKIISYVPIDQFQNTKNIVNIDAVLPTMVQIEPDPTVAIDRGTLTADRVQEALRYGLVPGLAWQCFVTSEYVDWAAWCEQHGKVQPIQSSVPDDGALGKPGELYSHLKPVIRGPDQRPVDPLGVKFISG